MYSLTCWSQQLHTANMLVKLSPPIKYEPLLARSYGGPLYVLLAKYTLCVEVEGNVYRKPFCFLEAVLVDVAKNTHCSIGR